MRFLMLGFRRFSSRDKHRHRPSRIDSFATALAEGTTSTDELTLDTLLSDIAEDPFEVWARLCAPAPMTDRKASSRTTRRGKRRMQLRRRD